MSGGRYAKGLPEFVYFVGETNDDWVMGPYVRPQAGRINRKFRLVEVVDKKLVEKNEALRRRLSGDCKPV